MFEMSPTCTNTSSQWLPSLANSCVFQQFVPDFNQSLFKFVQITNVSLFTLVA